MERDNRTCTSPNADNCPVVTQFPLLQVTNNDFFSSRMTLTQPRKGWSSLVWRLKWQNWTLGKQPPRQRSRNPTNGPARGKESQRATWGLPQAPALPEHDAPLEGAHRQQQRSRRSYNFFRCSNNKPRTNAARNAERIDARPPSGRNAWKPASRSGRHAWKPACSSHRLPQQHAWPPSRTRASDRTRPSTRYRSSQAQTTSPSAPGTRSLCPLPASSEYITIICASFV